MLLSSFRTMNYSMKALIASASGIIGQGRARALSCYGASVKGLARHPIAGMETVQTDLRDHC
jgi:hypothetical protein